MKRHILPFLVLGLCMVLSTGLKAGNLSPYLSPSLMELCQKPDTTKVLFPVPVDNGDPVQRLFNQSPLYLSDPENIKQEIVYDPVTGQYTFKRKIGDFEYQTPTTMSQDDYLKYQSQKGIMEYWKERRSQNGRSTTDGNSIIPPIYIGGKAFDMIFGSNTVEIRPQGSVDLSFGIKHNFRKDPSLTRQRTTNFDFDQDIQLNVIAKIGDKINFNINKKTKATFKFEDKMALKYEGKEDEIIQLLEA